MAQRSDWTRLDARPIRIILLGGIMFLCVGIFLFLATEVRQKLNELAFSPVDNMQWTLSQFEVEYLELVLSTERVLTLPETADPSRIADSLAEVRKRYDILYSRLDTLANGPLYAEAVRAGSMHDKFEWAAAEIRGLVPTIDSGDAELYASLPGMLITLDRLRVTVRGLLTQGNQVLVEMADRTRTEVALVLYRLMLASLVLLIALSLLVLIFRRLAGQNERRARQVLATSSRLETIVSTSRDAILVLDRHGQVETANQAAEAMFGTSRAPLTERWIGAFLFRGVEGRPKPLDSEDLRALCADDEKSALRLIGRNAEDVFPVEVSMNVTDREGAPVFVCVIRDISHQVEAEAELKESRDRALAGERAKARFLGVISHEMRTPLNGILGTVELMQDASEAELRNQYLPVLRNSANLLLELVTDVLEITRIEGHRKVQSDPFDLDQMIADAVASEAPRAQVNGNSLARVREASVGTVRGDARRLRTVLMNLLANAAKFTSDGEITVSAERLGGDMVEIQVADSGIGIAEADLPTIFEDFVRTDAALRLQIQGTGLGLGIARQLVRSMGGEIEAESIEGEGSLFRVILPLPVASPAPAPVPEPANAPGAATLAPMSILMVEDNATNRFITRRMLARLGLEVTEAHDGVQALELAGSRAFDLILMDVSMPNMDGHEATRRIRDGQGPNRRTRIVALTAHIGEEIAESLAEAGVDDVVAKPLTRAGLEQVIASTQSAAPGADAAWTPSPALEAQPLFDRDHVEGLLSSASPERVILQMNRFVELGDALLTAEAGATTDPEALAKSLHEMAGLAAVYGARRMHAALAAAEAAARTGDLDALEGALRTCRCAWKDTRAAVHRRRDHMAAQMPDAPRGAAE